MKKRPRKLLDQVREAIRLKHYPVVRPPRTKRHRTNRSIRTEQAYVLMGNLQTNWGEVSLPGSSRASVE